MGACALHLLHELREAILDFLLEILGQQLAWQQDLMVGQCIRIVLTALEVDKSIELVQHLHEEVELALKCLQMHKHIVPVSYTHLTLPTICSV